AFFSGSAPGFGGSDGPDAADTAAAIDTGPFLSPFDSSSDTCPDVISPLRSVSAQLRALVSAIVCAMWPLTPLITGTTDRASGNAVRSWNRAVIGCGGYVDTTGTDSSVPISRPIPLASTTMSLPTSL